MARAILTKRNELFADEYLKDFNATRAYGKVYGKTGSTAWTSSSRLLKKTVVQKYLQQKQGESEKQSEAEKSKPKRIPKPPEPTVSLAQKLRGKGDSELVELIERTKQLSKSMQTFLRDYEKELKSRKQNA